MCHITEQRSQYGSLDRVAHERNRFVEFPEIAREPSRRSMEAELIYVRAIVDNVIDNFVQ